MRQVFADTLCWGAIIHPNDQYRLRAILASKTLANVQLVTTDEVLTELLDGLAHRGPQLRRAAILTVETILNDSGVTVHPQSRDSLLAGMQLYRRRIDKGYSLMDCVSMNTMRREGIAEVLTNDRHFAQEGYDILL